VKLGDYLDLIRGIAYSSGNLLKSRDSIFLVNLKNINRGGGFKKEGLKDYSGEYKIEQLVEKDDIVVAMTDLTPQSEVIGMPALVPEIEKKACISMDIIKLSPKREGVDKKFLYYLLTDRNYKSWIKGFANGVNVLHLNSNGITGYTPAIPRSLDEQRRIASILSAFDEKIELNNKINKALEEMAQAIFKEWFVKFKFPGHEKVKLVDSELGKIPEGWEIKKFEEIMDFLDGEYIPQSKYDTSGEYLIYGSNTIMGRSNKYLYKGPIIILAKIGSYCGAIRYSHLPCWINNNAGGIRGKKGIPTSFIYYLLKRFNFNQVKEGTGQPFISMKGLKIQNAILPPQGLLDLFNKNTDSIKNCIANNEKENQKLAELRDLLLPKLMSGEIRV
jgi:type I restriction enzyme S subunit